MTGNDVGPGSAQLYKRLVSYIAPYKGTFALAVLAMIFTAGAEVGFAALLRPIMDKGFVDPDPQFIKFIPVLLILVLIVRAVAGFFSTLGMVWIGRRVVFDLRQQMFHRMVRFPAQYYDDHSSATLVSKLIYDVEQAATATTDALTLVTKDALTALGLFVWMWFLDWELTLVFVVFAPIVALLMYYAAKKFRAYGERIQDSVGGIAHVAKEAIIGHRVVKTYGGQQQEIDSFDQANRRNLRQQIKKGVVGAALVPLVVLVVGITIAAIIQLAIYRSGADKLSAGAFVSYLVTVVMILGPLKRLAKVNEKIQTGVAAAGSVFGLIDQEAEHDAGKQTLDHVRGRIEYRNVSFTYLRARDIVLKDLSFTIEPGQSMALVGASGSGKSTVAALLLGFYRPDSGTILIDGVDINDVTLASLRGNISIVTQEPILFDDSVRNNITYGSRAPVSEQRLNEAIEAAHVTEFAGQLPRGLDTFVGEQGVRLSGGQKQRIAIARALYKDAPILLLDEATSSLDAVSERLVHSAMDALMAHRTTLVIAHRLSTIENADRIMVLQRGSIVESGRHRELIARGGVYAGLYRSQLSDEQPLAESG